MTASLDGKALLAFTLSAASPGGIPLPKVHLRSLRTGATAALAIAARLDIGSLRYPANSMVTRVPLLT
jgi:hypothetical protein